MAVQSSVSVIIGAALNETFKGAFSDAKTQLATLGAAVKGLDKASENVKAFTKLKSDTATAKTEWQNAEQRLAALSAEMSKTDKPSKELQKNFKTAGKEAMVAKQAYDNNANALHDMGKQLTDAGINTKNLTAEQAKLGDALETLKRRQAAVAKNESAQKRNMDARAGYRAQIMDVVALGTTMYGMIQPAIAFESAMADVKKVVDFDGDAEIRAMESAIKDMAKTIPLSLEELTKIVAAGGQMGVPRAELTAFAETAAKMSVAFDMSADEAGQSMAELSNVLGMPVNQMNKVGDAINFLSNKMAAAAPKIVEATLRAGSMGKSFGLAYNETAALTATIIAMGRSPEIAGTAINMMTSRLKLIPVQTGAARDAFNQLGISMSDYTEMLESGRGKDAILAVLEALTKVQGVKRSQIMVDMFGEQANRHINTLVESLDKLKENFAMVGDEVAYAGSMEEEFRRRSETTENNIIILKNQLAIMATTIGSTLLPAINSVVGIFGKAASSIADFAEKHPTLFKYLGLAVTGLASVKLATFALGYGFTFLKGGLLSIMGVFTKARTIFTMAKLGIGALAPVLKILNAAFIASPIGLIIAGIAGAAFLIYKNWDWLGAKFKPIIDGLVAGFKTVCDWVTNVWGIIKNAFNDLKEWMSDTWIGKAWNWMTGGDDDKKSTSTPQTRVGDTVTELMPGVMPATQLPQSRISNSNMSSVAVNAPITINASPGMSETEVARQVARELDSRSDAAARRARGANYG